MQRPTPGKPFSFDFKLLRTACIALLSAQVPVLTAALPLGLHAPAAIAQSAEAAIKIANAITVRIEGATQGTGVIVAREGDTYTVLTAWHVISDQREGEELYIVTPDTNRHSAAINTISRIKNTDMATVGFTSEHQYTLANYERMPRIAPGQQVILAGFPASEGNRLVHAVAHLIAYSEQQVPGGYQIYYATSNTSIGMSGGPILAINGTLIGVHARGTINNLKTEQKNQIEKHEINSGVPISYYKSSSEAEEKNQFNIETMTPDDGFVALSALLEDDYSVELALRIADKSLSENKKTITAGYLHILRGNIRQVLGNSKGAVEDFSKAKEILPGHSYLDYARANARFQMGDYLGAISDYKKAIEEDPEFASAYFNYGNALQKAGRKRESISKYNAAISLDPAFAKAYNNRGSAKLDLGDDQGAMTDFNTAIQLEPGSQATAAAYYNRGKIRYHMGDREGAIQDFSLSERVDPSYSDPIAARGVVYNRLGRIGLACKDFRTAAKIGNRTAINLFKKYCS